MACYFPKPSLINYNPQFHHRGKCKVIFDYENNKWFQEFYGKREQGYMDPETFAKSKGYTPVMLPCGNCIGCNLGRSLDWSCRVVCEQSTRAWFHDLPFSSFLTLTYSDDCLPGDKSVHPAELSAFVDRLRSFYADHFDMRDIKFFACGEYGEQFGRPHYHVILLGVDFFEPMRLLEIKRNVESLRRAYYHHLEVEEAREKCGYLMSMERVNKQLDYLERSNPDYLLPPDANSCKTFSSSILRKLWPYGRVAIGSCTAQSVAYTARYCCKKLIVVKKIDRNTVEIEREGRKDKVHKEFLRMSQGLGREFLERNYESIYARRSVFCGDKDFHRIPRYFDKKLEQIDPELFAQIKKDRLAYIETDEFKKEHTPERLAAINECKEIYFKTRLLRNYEATGDYMEGLECSLARG